MAVVSTTARGWLERACEEADGVILDAAVWLARQRAVSAHPALHTLLRTANAVDPRATRFYVECGAIMIEPAVGTALGKRRFNLVECLAHRGDPHRNRRDRVRREIRTSASGHVGGGNNRRAFGLHVDALLRELRRPSCASAIFQSVLNGASHL